MKKISLILIGFLLIFSTHVKADEGMWLLSLLKQQEATMQKMGLKLTAEQIYSINNSSLKDAIVGLGRDGRPFSHFCTAEIISDQGLILTNHHCGYGSIQSHSTPENNILKDGFWAYSQDQELANPGMTASILVRMEEVTDQIIPELIDEMTEEERNKKISELAEAIETKAIEGSDYKANVRSMFEGNRYFLFVHVIYRDVRLVGNPPESMGKFGGDTDNWMWPRHTADFSMFRIYTAPDGSPAAYAEDNVPLVPKHHLPVSIKGVKQDDFAMVFGFPGRTNRYLTSFGLTETIDVTNTLRYNIRTQKLNTMKEFMEKDETIRLQYSSKFAGSANYWKYSNEQNKALRKLKTIENKINIEKSFTEWLNESAEKTAKYGNALKDIENVFASRKELSKARNYIVEALFSGAEMPFFASGVVGNLPKKLNDEDATEEDIKTTIETYKANSERFYKNYNADLDRKLFQVMVGYFVENASKEYFPEVLEKIETEYNGSVEAYTNVVYDNSIFTTKEKYFAFLENPNVEALENDPAAIFAQSVRGVYAIIGNQIEEKSTALNPARRLFVDGLMQMGDLSKMSPDANSTIRLTYGKVGGYAPKDAVKYNYVTTLKGVIEKEDPTNFEFIVPKKLVELYKKGDYGQYADENGKLVVNFLTDNDITGGNSGSPVINADGHLIGTAFDGNSEAMSGDIDFEENLQRCINLDVRYTLWIIDKFAGATNLIEEMTIVK